MSVIRPATLSDGDVIFEILLESYSTSEPVSVSLGVTRQEAEPFVRDFVDHYLPFGYSFVLENEGQIKGVYLANVVHRENLLYSDLPDPNLASNILTVESIARALSQDFWSLVPSHLPTAFHCLYVAVVPTFQRKGAGRMMTEYAMDYCRREDVPMIMMECLTEMSAKPQLQLGFRALHRIPLSIWTDPRDNKKLEVEGNEHSVLAVLFMDDISQKNETK